MLEIGATNEISIIVKEEDTANGMFKEFGTDVANEEYAKVLATPKMIGLMELAASKMLLEFHTNNQCSVGVEVNIKHIAATMVEMPVKAKATFLNQIGNVYHFKVEAFDNAGLIGEGFHSRSIIDLERLLKGAKKRHDFGKI